MDTNRARNAVNGAAYSLTGSTVDDPEKAREVEAKANAARAKETVKEHTRNAESAVEDAADTVTEKVQTALSSDKSTEQQSSESTS